MKNGVAKRWALPDVEGRRYSDPEVWQIDSPSAVGPYTPATYTSGIGDTANYQNARLWYPAEHAGPFPGCAFIAGLNTNYSDFPADVCLWHALASHGIATIIVDATNGGDQPRARETALYDAINSLVAEHTRSGSPLEGKLDTANLGVYGHSFGGAAALYAAESGTDSRIKAAIGQSPNPNDGLYDAVPSGVAMMIIGAVGDPFVSNFQDQYDSIPSGRPRVLSIFYNSGSTPDPHDIALYPLDTNPADDEVCRLQVAFFKAYLLGQAAYKAYLVTSSSINTFASADL